MVVLVFVRLFSVLQISVSYRLIYGALIGVLVSSRMMTPGPMVVIVVRSCRRPLVSPTLEWLRFLSLCSLLRLR